MIEYDWNEAARCLARQVGNSPVLAGWGVARLRLVDDTAPNASTLDDGIPAVVAAFGSDAVCTDPRAREVIARVRQAMGQVTGMELGFAVNDTGAAWVLLAGADRQRYQTAVGKALQHLLLEAALEDGIWDAWRAVYGLTPEVAGQPSSTAGSML